MVFVHLGNYLNKGYIEFWSPLLKKKSKKMKSGEIQLGIYCGLPGTIPQVFKK